MAITPEQARRELARRELVRRGIDPISGKKQGNSQQDGQGFASKAWDALTVPEKMSRQGLNQLADFVPTAEPTGDMARDIALNAPKVAADTIAEVAPSFISRSSILMSGAGKALEKSAPAANFVGNQAAKLGRVLSGNKPEDVKAIFQNPKAFISPTLSKAKQLYGEAVENAGPKIDVSVNEAFESAQKTARKILNKLNNAPDTIDELTALEGRRALDEVIKTTKSSRKVTRLHQYRDILDSIVKQDPGLANADKVYANAILASKFRNLQPVNLNGTPSVARSALQAGLTGFFQNPLPAIAMSPITVGATAAGLGLLKKGIVASNAAKNLSRLGLVSGAILNKKNN